MSINKNDCLDCDNLISNTKGEKICNVTGKVMGYKYSDIHALDSDCESFAYPE